MALRAAQKQGSGKHGHPSAAACPGARPPSGGRAARPRGELQQPARAAPPAGTPRPARPGGAAQRRGLAGADPGPGTGGAAGTGPAPRTGPAAGPPALRPRSRCQAAAAAAGAGRAGPAPAAHLLEPGDEHRLHAGDVQVAPLQLRLEVDDAQVADPLALGGRRRGRRGSPRSSGSGGSGGGGGHFRAGGRARRPRAQWARCPDGARPARGSAQARRDAPGPERPPRPGPALPVRGAGRGLPPCAELSPGLRERLLWGAAGGLSLEQRRLRGDLTTLQLPARRVQPGGDRSLLPGNSDRTGGRGPTLHHWRFRFDIRKKVFTEKVVGHRTGCPGRWWSHCPWRCLGKDWTWLWVPWSCWHWFQPRLDSMMSEVFSNLATNVIPACSGHWSVALQEMNNWSVCAMVCSWKYPRSTILMF